MAKTYTHYTLPTPVLGSAPYTGPAPLRRTVLAGGAAALALTAGVVAAGGAHPASPDATLIALCASLDELQRRIGGLFAGGGRSMTDAELGAADAAAYHIDGEQRVLLDRIGALTPATLSGHAALARSLVLLRPDLAGAGPDEDLDVRLLAVLVRGLAGRA